MGNKRGLFFGKIGPVVGDQCQTTLRQGRGEGGLADAGIASYEKAVTISLQARAVQRNDAHGSSDNTDGDGDEQRVPKEIVAGRLGGEHGPHIFAEQIINNKTARRYKSKYEMI